jgi:DNA invertase Pin-like site-specific DNA recombinase
MGGVAVIYAYVRVSTREQNEDRQLIAMRECRLRVDKMYVDKQSGKK